MTAIAYRDGIMAADSVSWTALNSSIKVPSRPKIIRPLAGGVLGCMGEASEIEHIRHSMLRGPPIEPAIFDKEYDTAALWAREDGTLAMLRCNGRWFEIASPFYAAGASDTFIWGALHAGASAELAVRLAVEHTDGAGGEVQVERLRPAPDPDPCIGSAPKDGTYIEVRIGSATIQNVYWCDEASNWASGGREFNPGLPATATWRLMEEEV